MKQTLVIDLGNTKAKLARFSESKLVDLCTIEGELAVADLEDFIAGTTLNGAILSSVVHHNTAIESFLERETTYIRFNQQTNLPLINDI